MASKAKTSGDEGRPPRREMPWGDLPRAVRTDNPPAGLVVVDKDAGVTSHDIVGAVRRLAGTRKVGHAGTLDPMATGVLCLGVGGATKLLQYVTGTSKEYTATIRLGIETTTEDAEGTVTGAPGASYASGTLPDAPGTSSSAHLCIEELRAAMAGLTGDIMQVPSAVSALKIGGKRAYELAREGQAVHLEARPVTVHAFELLGEPRPVSLKLPEAGAPAAACRPVGAENPAEEQVVCLDLDVRVECSAGTYIRALARDLGRALGTEAHLTALRRTRVGKWTHNEAFSVAALGERVRGGEPLPLVGLADLCTRLFPVLPVLEDQARALRHGQFLPAPADCPHGKVFVAMESGQPVALVEAHPKRPGELKPTLVFSHKVCGKGF